MVPTLYTDQWVYRPCTTRTKKERRAEEEEEKEEKRRRLSGKGRGGTRGKRGVGHGGGILEEEEEVTNLTRM